MLAPGDPSRGGEGEVLPRCLPPPFVCETHNTHTVVYVYRELRTTTKMRVRPLLCAVVFEARCGEVAT